MKKLIKLCRLCNRVYRKASFHTSIGTDGDIKLEGSTLYIIFRGTELSFKDIIVDCLFFKRTIPYNTKKIKVHTGFYLAYLSVKHYIHTLFMNDKIKKVIVTGHSLGGALAMLCALDIQYNFGIDVECVAFGTPRVGNKYFVKSYNKRVPNTQRIVNGNCIVSRLPFKFFGYRDAGEVLYIQHLPSWFLFAKGCCKDHYPENYLKELEKCLTPDSCYPLLKYNKKDLIKFSDIKEK